MTLHIHRAERADRLARALGELLAHPLADPFRPEVVSVPTPGVERWLSQALSHQLGTGEGDDGVCAGIDFSAPRRVVQRATSAAGADPDTDPWQPARSVWPLLAVIDRSRGEPWAALLWSYLGVRDSSDAAEDPARIGRRYATARHLAELFSSYAANRPEMTLAWAAGRDVDGAGAPLGPDYAWQAELWRRLRTELGGPGPAERIRDACHALHVDPTLTDLPERLSVFGATRLSTEQQLVLTALAAHRDVHLWLPHPSPELWLRVRERVGAHPLPAAAAPRRGDSTVDLPRHRLLAYLGRDSRELQLRLSSATVATQDHHYAPLETPAGPAQHPPSLLTRLQDDIAADRSPVPPADRPLLDPADRSIQLHSSHGPDRQVEVLREVLVGLLASDATLEPRDILVMCPDIESFAPLISASFGLDTEEHESDHPGHRLRVRLADRSVRQLNPLLATLAQLLEMTEARVEASTLLDLLAAAPVARKFRFSEDDLLRISDLVARSGVRWGLDQEHRGKFQMGRFGQNTWSAGLDRLLLGVTMAEDDEYFIGTTLPLDDVDSSDVDLVGRLAECVDRVRTALVSFGRRQPLAAWVAACRAALDALTSVSATDAWQLGHAYAELGRLAESAGALGTQVELSLADLRSLLAGTFRGRASRANFRTGTLTMSTMLPMRSVPHRVVCLLGVDDGVYPRIGATDGDDILAADPCVGDRDPRSEDRQLLLDAVMAATEHLVVIYSGADPRTNAHRPPAVPIGELLDTLDLTVRNADGSRVQDVITVSHPLQPFDPANFTPQALTAEPRPFSFDRASMAGARAAAGARRDPAPTFDLTPLPPVQLDRLIALEDLIRFFDHPVKAFLRTRAGLSLFVEDPLPDEMAVALDGLQSWAVGDRLLRLRLRGVDLERSAAAEWRRGELPPQQFGERALRPVVSQLDEVIASAAPYLAQPRTSVDAVATLPDHTVSGTLTGLHGTDLVAVGYSTLASKHRFQSWLRLLALTVHDPAVPWRSIAIGRRHTSVLGPVTAEYARTVLADLVQLYATGLSEPLPLAAKASCEYARLRGRGQPVEAAIEAAEHYWRQDADEAYGLFFGAGAGLDVLLAQPSRQAEERGALAEPSRFGTLSRRVWNPLLEREAL
ncbi:exodeoxyribonuclease V subunit gamma [Microlunatus panaciterrae]|uniref:RecBCD enzyme subunit RecC n=1 Tax=Microlunatus panaciterrae TaxID=400768 RepID=A0ABS2RFI1_9ACTN|nr:exodeoxyribonuclease V subunit gamma [Microlunatus panaciterrae]MBM7797498.1 exodeoxyribonuclease V gamma subunit [Microlunatus panaciterrae]